LIKTLSNNLKRLDLNRVIHDLMEEKKQLDAVISSLEMLEKPETSTAGAQNDLHVPKRRGRRSMSPDERQKVSARMKGYWLTRHASEETKELPERASGSSNPGK